MSGKIITPGRNTWRLCQADDSRVIVDAEDYYRAFYQAALRARSYLLISGWQFDRGVQLLRGTHAVGHGDDVKLVRFLDGLCERTPALRIYMLAWDFHMVFALEREWMQRLWFHYATNERLVFRFDDVVVDQGSHHQKFVVVDGREAFLGGIDLCESRWDDRGHRTVNPLRVSRGRRQKPYHDLQAHLIGTEVASALRDLFVDRWSRSGRQPLQIDGTAAGPPAGAQPQVPCIDIGPATVGLSRTDPRGKDDTIVEIEHLFRDAIAAAERLIYIETQYFSSARIRDALIARMEAGGHLEIVVVVNQRAEAIKEEIAVGLRQAKNLEELRAVAARTGHALGVYYTMSDGAGPEQRATYIHSKLLAVDDRFLSVGSANLTNRSMEVDSELHVSWEVPADAGTREERAVARGIRRVRVSLLAEHAGLSGARAVRGLVPVAGLVARLDAIVATDGRLRAHGPPTQGQKTAMDIVDPEELPFDPLHAEYDGEPAHLPDETPAPQPGR